MKEVITTIPRLDKIADRVAHYVDMAVGIVSPQSEVARRQARLIGKRYAAAKPTRLGQSWRPPHVSVNSRISSEAPVLRERVSQLIRDFAPIKRAHKVLIDYSVGTGLSFHSRVRDDSGDFNMKVIRSIETGFARWCDEVDPAGLLDFDGLQRLSKGQDVELGEFLCVLARVDKPGRYLPFALLHYDADWLTSRNAKGVDGRDLIDDNMLGKALPSTGIGISAGIEYDRSNGMPRAYHFLNPDSNAKSVPVRVSAEYVLHGFDVLRAGQMHGVSPLVAAVMFAKDISEYMDAELDAAQMGAKWLAFVERKDPGGWQTNNTLLDANGSRIEKIDNAVLEYLQQGEEIKFSASGRPSSAFEPFVKFVLRLMAIATDTTYELLSGDYTDLNYSNLKAIRNDLIRGFKPHIARHRFQYCRRVQQWFLDFAVLEGRLLLPDYYTNKAYYQRGLWLPPGHESPDPLREGKADSEALASLLQSPQEIAARRGRDYEEILDEIWLARQWEADRKLVSSQAKASGKNNPAALGAAEEGGS